MYAYLFLADRRNDRNLYNALAYGALAASGDTKAITKQLETWEREQ